MKPANRKNLDAIKMLGGFYLLCVAILCFKRVFFNDPLDFYTVLICGLVTGSVAGWLLLSGVRDE